MKKKLVVSLDTYSWIKHCAGSISREPKSFDIIIICTDDVKPILNYEKLCNDAIYAQRSYDLFKIGKELGIKKMMNLRNSSDSIDIAKLSTQLQLHIALGGIGTVYHQYSPLLSSILEKFKEMMNINVYFYNNIGIPDPNIRRVEVRLNDAELHRKLNLTRYMVGIENRSELPYCDNREIFYTKG